MKKCLTDDLVVKLTPYLKDLSAQDLRMHIEMALANYDITKSEHALTVYEGDINDSILKRFLSAKIAQGCSMRTVRYYKNSVTSTLEKIGKPYMDVTADDVRLYLAYRIHRDQVSKTTVNNERRNLSAFYGWLQREEILLKNPMSKVDAVKETRKKKKAFEQIEIEKIRDKCRSKGCFCVKVIGGRVMNQRDCIHKVGLWCAEYGCFCGEYPGTGLDACETAYEREEEEDETN